MTIILGLKITEEEYQAIQSIDFLQRYLNLDDSPMFHMINNEHWIGKIINSTYPIRYEKDDPHCIKNLMRTTNEILGKNIFSNNRKAELYVI